MLQRHPPFKLSIPRISTLAIVFAAVLGVASTGVGAHNALRSTGSQDMQWSGVHLLLQHRDPWAEYLAGRRRIFALEQYPNYLPILYLLTVPLGLLTLDHAKVAWLLCNLLFAVSSSLLITQFYGLRRRLSVLVLCLFLVATPTRNTIGNGQTSLLILLLWSMSLLAPAMTDTRSAIAGTSYLKFNFAPPTFIYVLFRSGPRAILISACPHWQQRW